ncbi:pentatricopeptide repeat-containing protein At1g77405 [Apium graveolens]|uniref:pentatricopeptide repeat-containing protein At1g77405 n=1 Tax=Apium graveolens TaxID=4045 RepID=UPI003D795FA2
MMRSSNASFGLRARFINQVMAAMIKNHPFDVTSSGATNCSDEPLSAQGVSEILRLVPRLFFQSPRSVGCQKGFRHRAPLKQRNLGVEMSRASKGVRVVGPAGYRDLGKVKLGLNKALGFYYWVERRFGFTHSEMTCREMACVLAKGNDMKLLWDFLKEMSRRGDAGLVTTATVTCLIKVLGEEGLADEALVAFYRMKQFHCKQDVYAYNTVINALCRVGNFRKAKFLLEQMELPGFKCPPDTYTYTILISAYCKYSLQTGCRKAIRRRLWEANHLFRNMLFKGFVPDVVTYNCLIDGCCKTYRIERAIQLYDDMIKRGCAPNRVTYNSFIRYYSAVNEIDKAIEMLHKMQRLNHGFPTTSSYTPIIHALCEAGRIQESWDFLVQLVESGSIPREYTYRLVCDLLKSEGEANLLDANLCRRIEEGIKLRCRDVMLIKPTMSQNL